MSAKQESKESEESLERNVIIEFDFELHLHLDYDCNNLNK